MTKITVAGAVIAVAFSGLTLQGRLTASSAADAQAAKASTQPSIKPDDLDKLLAPVALYPDQLLSQILLCAQKPGKVGALSEWLASQTVKGSELQDAATKSGFDPSFVALTVFPDVVHSMATQPQWTSSLGDAFTADPKAVFASIQRLRQMAKDKGTLKSTPQQDVETRTSSSGQQVIVIEPSNPQVVYVPQYNPQVVYTQPASTTVVVQEDNTSEAVAAGLIGFTAGIAIGAAIDNNYYYGPYGWHGGFNMYDDAWDDYYDAREDAREDWSDNREDLAENRTDRAKDAQEQRTERTQTRQENRPESQAQRTERQQTRQENGPQTQAQRDQRKTDAQSAVSQAKSQGAATAESRGYSREQGQAAKERSGTKSDAFSGYSSGRSERSASERGQRSRSSSRSGGSRRR